MNLVVWLLSALPVRLARKHKIRFLPQPLWRRFLRSADYHMKLEFSGNDADLHVRSPSLCFALLCLRHFFQRHPN